MGYIYMLKNKLKIALFSTPRVAVPPPKYGGTELIVYNLAEGLVKRAHDVTVFATGDSHSSAKLDYICQKSGYSQELPLLASTALLHSSYGFAKIKKGNFDLIHNHYAGWGIAFARLLDIPLITTYHGDFATDLKPEEYKIFKQLAARSKFVAISHSQIRHTPFKLNWLATVYNGIEIDKFEFNSQPRDYFVWLGRFSPAKGAKEAILAARRAEVKLFLAGRLSRFHPEEIRYFNHDIKPLLDGRQIRYLGEISHQEKVKLLKNARALINPIAWSEPFGLVMVEAQACGTPVIANRRGSVPEVVADGETGFITDSQLAIAHAIKNIDQINRWRCRERVENYFSIEKMTEGYERLYYKLLKN